MQRHHSTQLSLFEEWRPVVGHESLYAVSNMGTVKRIANERNTYPGRMLKAQKSHDGYLRVRFHTPPKWHFVHNLVAEAFNGPKPNRYLTNHIDGDKLNNSPENLEYLTSSESAKHRDRLRLRIPPKGILHPMSKLTESEIYNIRQSNENSSVLAIKYGVHYQTIHKIRKRILWQHLP